QQRVAGRSVFLQKHIVDYVQRGCVVNIGNREQVNELVAATGTVIDPKIYLKGPEIVIIRSGRVVQESIIAACFDNDGVRIPGIGIFYNEISKVNCEGDLLRDFDTGILLCCDNRQVVDSIYCKNEIERRAYAHPVTDRNGNSQCTVKVWGR